MELAIIIPAYNEEVTIKEVITRFHKAAEDASIYVIDNNSKDSTRKIAEKTIKKLSCKGAVIFEGRQGKGNAVRRAFMDIDADIYAMVDADLTYSEKDLAKLIQPIKENVCDIVVGDRLTEGLYSKENKRMFHDFGNNLVKGMINFLYKNNIKDVMSGYRIFNRFFVKNFPILSEGFEIETEMTLHTLDKRFRVKEIPISYVDRPEGSESKLNTISDGIRVVKTIFTIFKHYKPLSFFGIATFMFFILGLAAGIPPIIEFIQDQFVKKVPLSILASGLMICAIINFAIGLILDTVVKYNRFNYELQLLHYKNSETRETRQTKEIKKKG